MTQMLEGAVMSYAEAGKRLGMHPASVLSTEKRAMEKLRNLHPELAEWLEEERGHHDEPIEA